MLSENDFINTILAAHFSGEKMSEEQEKVLINWICTHQEEYNRLSDLFNSINKKESDFDTDDAWKRISKKISKPIMVQVLNLRQYLAYAACLAILFTLSFLYVNQKENKVTQYFNSTESLLAVTLPDSSVVTLYPQSQLSFLHDTKNDYRMTTLSGQAFFKVKSNPKLPFIVKNHDVQVKVLGTSFLINGNDSLQTAIYVREGIVEVAAHHDKVILHADEQAISKGDSIQKSEIQRPEVIFTKHIKQKTYRNTPLSTIIKDIENEFNIEISVSETILRNRISASLKFVNTEMLLSEICYICNIKYEKISDRRYIISN